MKIRCKSGYYILGGYLSVGYDATSLEPYTKYIFRRAKSICFHSGEIEDFMPLQRFKKLESINVEIHTDIQMKNLVTALLGCPYVNEIRLNLGTSFVDIEPLAKLKSLRILWIHCDSHEVGRPPLDITPLKKFQALEKLDIVSWGVTDCHPLETLTNLKVLEIPCTLIEDIKPLANLKNLRYLRLPLLDGLDDVKEISEEDFRELQRALPNCIIDSETFTTKEEKKAIYNELEKLYDETGL